MALIVIEHVKPEDLPPDWRARLPVSSNARLTVRIDEETESGVQSDMGDSPLFGMWRDRDEIADVEHFARDLRSPRYLKNPESKD